MKQQTVRLLRASGMVGICAFAFPAVCMAIEQGSPADAGAIGDLPPASIGLDASSIEWGGNPYAALDQLEELASTEAQPSDVFVREAGFPSGAREQHADMSGMVVGCTLDSPEDVALAAVCDALATKGWACVPLQGMSGATFVKREGELRWMLITCTQIGEATSVVYRLDCSGLEDMQ